MNRWLAVPLRAANFRRWLLMPGSLTRALTARCPDFHVRRLAQAHLRPLEDERRNLHLRRGQLALVREVLLMDGDTPLVFAHSVIPLHGLEGPWAGLAGLGNRPLGAALFADPRIERLPLECRCLDRRHPLYPAASRHFDGLPRTLWARRSRFLLAGHALLVTEVFLPAILRLP